MIKHLPWWSISGTAAALICAAVPDLFSVLVYDRSLIATGEYWRLLSCHLLHWSSSHLWYNCVVFLLLGAWCELQDSGATPRLYLLSVLLISAVLWLSAPQLQWYCGLSGIIAAQVVLALRSTWLQGQDRWERTLFTLIFAGLLLKICYEQFSQQSVFASMDSIPPSALAHLAGMLSGFLLPLGSAEPIRCCRERVSGNLCITHVQDEA